MRIMIVNTWYYPNLMGGAEHSVKLLAEKLVKSGKEVAVFSIDNRNKGIVKEIINGVTVYRSSAGKYNLYKAYETNTNMIYKVFQKNIEVYNPTIKKEYLEVCDEFKPDIIHTNCLSGISLNVWKINKSINIPTVHTIRDYWLLSPRSIIENENKINKIYRIYLKLFQKYCRKKSRYVEFVTAPSKFTLNTMINNGFFENAKQKLCIVNSIEVNSEKLIRVISEKKKRKEEKIKFIYAGWLSEEKGVKNLISAFTKINNNKIELIICGDGKLKNYIEDSTKKDGRLKYLGKLKPIELEKEYYNADVLIIPSVWEEPFGRVVIEGNLQGLPVIGSNRGGIPEIISTMKSGIVYNGYDEFELINSINKLSSREAYERFYENIIQNIHIYDVENQINDFLELYKYALSLKK